MATLVIGAGQAAASTSHDTVGTNTQRMSQATLNSTQHGLYMKGSHLTLECYVRGQSVKGYYSRYVPGGWDNLWYKVSDGYYVADIDIDTGSNNPVTGQCSAGRKWGQTERSNSAVGGQCTWGAKEKFHSYSGVYPRLTGNAKDWYNSARATGWSTSLDAQPNSIVVFQPYVEGAGYNGHVAWVQSVSRTAGRVYISIIEMNYGKSGAWTWHTRVVPDVVGMSYILAPNR